MDSENGIIVGQGVGIGSGIATGITYMLQLYSPDVLIFSGGQSKPEGYLFRKVIFNLKEILPPERRACEIAVTALWDCQSAVGAARLAYERFF